jgi:hypothetical protein
LLDAEHARIQQQLDLAAAIGLAVAEGRRVAMRPEATPVGQNEQQAALGRQHTPDFAQGITAMFAELQAMHAQHAIDA